MSTFITRVELHDTNDDSSNEYQVLHQAMEDAGFKRTIKGVKGEYQLPPAEYIISGELTLNEVRELAINAANASGKTNSVVVSETNGSSWSNLKKVS